MMRSYKKVKYHAGGGGYSAATLANHYGFPLPNPSAKNVQKIILAQLGGGFLVSDVEKYRKDNNLGNAKVNFIGLGGATNAPDGADGAQGEVMLDLCVTLGCTGGTVDIDIVTAPNTDAGYQSIYDHFANDTLATILSSSWGSLESNYTPQAIQAMTNSMQKCFALGKTMTSAAGDNGSSDGGRGNNCDFPSSSPYNIGCGGTSLPSLTSPEVVWNNGMAGGASGGGVSSLFAIPSYQNPVAKAIPGNGRGVPDISGPADPTYGWLTLINGMYQVIGGTSAVAPMIASLIALLNQNLGYNIGNSWTTFYTMQDCFNDITQGDNGTYKAKTGYDCVTGLGTPKGQSLLAALKGLPMIPVSPPTIPVSPPTIPGITMTLKQPLTKGSYVVFGNGHVGNIDLNSNVPAGVHTLN